MILDFSTIHMMKLDLRQTIIGQLRLKSKIYSRKIKIKGSVEQTCVSESYSSTPNLLFKSSFCIWEAYNAV